VTNRSSTINLPQAPIGWTPSDRETWARLVSALEGSPLFNRGRRTAPQFLIQGSVSAAVTLNVDTPDLDALTHIVARLLVALNQLPQVDVRT
jgi:hypothetical protein